MSLPLPEKITLPHDMVIFPNSVFGEMAGGLETVAGQWVEQIGTPKNENPKSVRNGPISFLGAVFGKMAGCSHSGGYASMRKKNFKGRCEKRVIGKCAEVCRTYDAVQYAYADVL